MLERIRRPYSFHTIFSESTATDVLEDDKGYDIKINLPGVKKEGLKINVNDRVLTVSATVEAEKIEEGKRWALRIERSTNSFTRSFSLPENVDAASIKAELKDGVLNIRIDKTEVKKTEAVTIPVA
jgi:HSP20 family protein